MTTLREVSAFVVVEDLPTPWRMPRAVRDDERMASETMYGTPGEPERFARRCINGAFGRRVEGWVYFIGDAEGGPVKIGHAIEPAKRVRELQVGHPFLLHVLAAIRAPREAEGFMHGLFHPDRLRGEWFQRSPTLVAFLAALARPCPTMPSLERLRT